MMKARTKTQIKQTPKENFQRVVGRLLIAINCWVCGVKSWQCEDNQKKTLSISAENDKTLYPCLKM